MDVSVPSGSGISALKRDFIRKNIEAPRAQVIEHGVSRNRRESVAHNGANVNGHMSLTNISTLKELYGLSNSNSSNNDMNKYSQRYQSNTEPSFIKKRFSKETIKRFRQYNGVFFGLPV